MAATCWWYYIAKFTEFFDTIFFNLRKKTEHVSTLHVIHHGCMPFSVWLGLKFAPGNYTSNSTYKPIQSTDTDKIEYINRFNDAHMKIRKHGVNETDVK